MKSFGVMFHHFHDNKNHIVSQGSIDYNTFYKMIDYLKYNYNLLNADEFYWLALKEQLNDDDICLTFDDCLACQYDIAFPVLKEHGIKAFWFLYSSPLAGNLEKLEIFRHFRFKCFESIEQFYDAYFTLLHTVSNSFAIDIDKALQGFDPKQYAKGFDFYTDQDKKFRFIRDQLLTKEEYERSMEKMMRMFHYDMDAYKEFLWIKPDQVKALHKDGQVIGLHSHTHPTNLNTFSYNDQLEEYKNNKEILEKIIQNKVQAVSYPCNSFNEDTDTIMNLLDIQLGFNAKIDNQNTSTLHIQREDHVNILKEINANESNRFYKQSS